MFTISVCCERANLRSIARCYYIPYAIVKTVKPNANETPRRPIPSSGNPADKTALPHPPKTSQNVPIPSAINFFIYLLCVSKTARKKTIKSKCKFFLEGSHYFCEMAISLDEISYYLDGFFRIDEI